MVQEFPGSIPHHLSPFRLVHADIVISSVSSLQYLFPFFSFISEILCAGTSLALGLPSTTSRSKCPSYIPSVFFIYHRNTSIRHLRWALKVHFLQQLPFKIQAHYCLLASYTAVRSRNNLTYWQWKATGPFFFHSDQSVNLRGSYTWYTFNHNHPISCNPAHHPAPSFPPKKSRTTCGSFKIPSVRAIILTRHSLLCPHIPTGITCRTTHLSFYFQVFMCPHLQFCSQIHAPMPFRPSFPIVCCLPCSFKRFQNLPAKISSFIHLTLSQDSCFPHRSNNRNPDTAVETELCSFLSGA